MEILTKILNFIISPEITGWLLFFKIFFLIISFLAIVFIIWVLAIRTDWLNWWLIWDLKEFFTLRPYGVPKVTKNWERIKKRLETHSEEEYKSAILEADELLNTSFKKLKVGLDTLEETLRKRIGPNTISNIEDVKKAHQVRNNIIYHPELKISLEEAQKLLEIYEKALKEMNMI